MKRIEDRNWDDVYRKGATPWDVGRPVEQLIELVETGYIKPTKALDLGCGTGNEAIFLSKKGFDVTAVDISNIAIKNAKGKAKKENVKCKFYARDALKLGFLKGGFGFIFDRGCFHFLQPEDRIKYISNVKSLLGKNGKFLIFVSSTKEENRGPYQFSKHDIIKVFGKHFEIVKIKLVVMENHELKAMPYMCLMKSKN